jgi:hypothetical protein
MRRQPLLRARRAGAYASLIFFVLFVTGMSGCGGASTASTVVTSPPPPPPQVTPKGNYQIIVTATANNVPAQSITLTLTVN